MFNFLKNQPTTPKPIPETDYVSHLLGSDNVYTHVYTSPVNMISIFDDIRFDRSDIDNLSPGMYRYINTYLTKLGFERCSGRVFEHTKFDLKCIIPKSRVQGSSPFHVIDYTPKREHDFYILTPTQSASVIISTMQHADAVPLLIELAQRHPFNIFKLKDHIDTSRNHQDYLDVIPHLKFKQREAISQEPLKRLRALK